MTPPVTYFLEADGIGWIVIDAPDSRVNVFTPQMQDALDAAMTEAGEDAALKALIVISGKERSFIAGADLKLLAALPDAGAATEFSRRGQRLFQRFADFRVPVVCAIHGACAGGGLELALACHWRIASEADATRIGLPETSLGTIPGWGGSIRLPRLIGVQPALDHILEARLVSAQVARDAGMVNEVVPSAELLARARWIALELAGQGTPPSPAPPAPRPDLCDELRRKVDARIPALRAIIEVVEETSQSPMPEALETEARVFGEISTGIVCRNLVRVFFLREAAKKRTLEGWFDDARPPLAPATPIRRVAVIGAGVMGSGITQWLAAHGFDVVLRDVDAEILERALAVIRRLFDEAVKRGKLGAGEANAALHRISTTTQWDGVAECGLVIEAIVEEAQVKRSLFSEVARIVRADAILASNTSALPIEEIAGHVPHPERTLGIHFFNPVSRMPLVELILGRSTSRENAERALAIARRLGKTPLVCRSSPGFLVTRVLFFYLNAAVRLRGLGRSTEEIDAAMRAFGWPMGPLRLIDEVGVDVTDFIFREMEHYFPSRFARATLCERMLRANLPGRKNGASRGFYRYGGKVEAVNEEVAEMVPASAAGSVTREELGDTLMRVMVDEAQRCLDERVVRSEEEVDFALLAGAGFPAFRGGLMHWARGPHH